MCLRPLDTCAHIHVVKKIIKVFLKKGQKKGARPSQSIALSRWENTCSVLFNSLLSAHGVQFTRSTAGLDVQRLKVLQHLGSGDPVRAQYSAVDLVFST